nr:PREDICTED: conserved oligomeric Golgi complex subunit 8-like [Bemisia tabaci]
MVITDTCNHSDEVKLRFPVKSTDELKLQEDDLLDPDLRKKCISYFSKMNTKSLGDSVRKIAKQIMTDNLALQYSWTGRKEGKSALADYPMFITVLQEAVRFSHKVTNEDINVPFKLWLVKAKERLTKPSGESEDEDPASNEDNSQYENEEEIRGRNEGVQEEKVEDVNVHGNEENLDENEENLDGSEGENLNEDEGENLCSDEDETFYEGFSQNLYEEDSQNLYEEAARTSMKRTARTSMKRTARTSMNRTARISMNL